MDVCDGGYNNSHEWVSFRNDIGCPMCELRESMGEEVDDWKTKYSDMEVQAEEHRLEAEELANKLAQYDGLDDSIKKMIKERM